MATTPGPRRRASAGIRDDDDRDTLTPMQEPLGSLDRPGSRTSDINEVNLPPGETVRHTGNLSTTNSPPPETVARGGRGFVSTFAIVAVMLLAAFLIASYLLGTTRDDIATGTGTTNPPIADSNSVKTSDDATGSTTAPAPQTAAGTGDSSGATTPPANP